MKNNASRSSTLFEPRTRRGFLAQSLALAGGGLAGAADRPLLESIRKEVLVPEGAPGPLWFHPRACLAGDRILMTLQPITGSDHFGHVHFTLSTDSGKTWAPFEPIPALGAVPAQEGWNESVCDVTPEFHPKSGAVLALGHNVFYREKGFEKNQPPRWPVYAVWKDGVWGPRRKLAWDDPRGAYIYSNNCGQRLMLPDGDVLMSFTFGLRDQPRAVCGVRCSFNGGMLEVKQTGNALTNPKGRGLLEPSLTCFKGKFYLTLRAEDRRGYVALSEDGLNYEPQKPWQWDNGEPLVTSTTQQHWLTHSDGLFLVYTRYDDSNAKITRWRSPLWVAQVDVETLRLIKATERVVLPIQGDAVNHPELVAFNGNFGVANVSAQESWVTDGSWCPRTNRGELALARIGWSKPNTRLTGFE